MSDKNIIQKIQTNLDGGHFYEAQQLYKTLYHKFSKAKNFEKATQILINGIEKFAEKEQFKLLNDLAIDLLEVFEKAEYKTTTQVISKKENSNPISKTKTKKKKIFKKKTFKRSFERCDF